MNVDFSTAQIEMVRAKVRVFEFDVVNLIDDSVVSLSSWSNFWFVAKASVSDADGSAAVFKTLGSGITVTDATNGVIQVQIEPADTASLPNTRGTYFAQFQGRAPDGEPWALWQGMLVLQPNLITAN